MKYLDPSFTVGLGGKAYSDGWERTFNTRHVDGDANMITVNGCPIKVPREVIAVSYEKLVADAGFQGHPSVTYARCGVDGSRSGCLAPGCLLDVRNGAVINIADTSRA